MTTTLLDAGLLFLLRWALDDNVAGVMAAAAHALRALLVSDQEEVREGLCSVFFAPLCARPSVSRIMEVMLMSCRHDSDSSSIPCGL